MNLNCYYNHNSLIHRLSPGVKLSSVVIIASILFLISNLLILGTILFNILILYRIAHVPLKILYSQMRVTILILLGILLINIIIHGLLIGLIIITRLSILLLFSSLVIFTTRTEDLINAFENFLALLPYIRIYRKKITFTLLLTIRFIPIIADIYREVMIAQKSRNLEYSIIAIIIPTIIKTLKAADEIADAIESRS